MDRIIDFRRFWIEKRDIILAWAQYSGLPIYELNRDMSEGLIFHQVRYLTKKGKEKTKWMTDKPLKKKQKQLNELSWIIFPAGIYPTKRSLDPKEQRYKYLVKMTDKDGRLCSAMISIRWEGTIVKQDIDIGKGRVEDIREEIPAEFRYPRAIFARINRCMAHFFWGDLWCGPAYAAWYRQENAIAVYMGTQKNAQNIEFDGLCELLQSCHGDEAAVLLSYTCFSMLRPWFTDYPMLNSKSAYFEVKKKLPQLLALNIQSEDMKSAEHLAELCCGAFWNMGEGKLPVCDGVSMQKFPKRRVALNENVFEKKVLQSANVLWVNRKPAKEIRQKNRVLNLRVPSGFNRGKYKFESSDIIRALAIKVSAQDLDTQINIMKTDRRRQTSVAIEALKKLQSVADKYNFDFQDIDFADEFTRLQKDDPAESLVSHFTAMRHTVHREIIEENEKDGFDKRSFDEATKKVFSDCLREMRKIHKENCTKENFLTPYYQRARREIEEIGGVKAIVQNKVTFLWASAQFFITLLPEMERLWVRQKIFHALISFAKQQEERWSASEYLEGYLLDEIRGGNCARIRGEGSDSKRISVWYDPKNQLLLLPTGKYYERVSRYIKEPQMTQRIFEQKLVEEGTLVTVKRGDQRRRTFEVKVKVGVRSTLVLKVRLDKFWEKCRADRRVVEELRKLYQETTPLRAN